MTDNLYARQQALDVEPPHTVTVIGVGGVGSWVALDLALAGVQKLYVVDPDHIERHNLNRTPFKEGQIEKDKTTAVVELVAERRMDAEVVPIKDRIEETAGAFRDEMAENPVIDCRDHASELPDDISSQVVLTAGYDGLEYTLHTNPDYEAIWGEEDTEYETVPSFIAPPQFVASLITTITCSPQLREGEEQIATQDMRETIENLFDNPTQNEEDGHDLPDGWEAGAGERNSEQQYTKFFYKPEADLELRVYSDPDEDHSTVLRDEEMDSVIHSRSRDTETEATDYAFEVMNKVNRGDL